MSAQRSPLVSDPGPTSGSPQVPSLHQTVPVTPRDPSPKCLRRGSAARTIQGGIMLRRVLIGLTGATLSLAWASPQRRGRRPKPPYRLSISKIPEVHSSASTSPSVILETFLSRRTSQKLHREA